MADITQGELVRDIILAMEKIKQLEADNHNLECQVRIWKEKYEEMWLSNKIQMSRIVEYRRIIEHYEDGAPLYVQKDS